jgi:DNA-binding MarR family transcriptional regulator
MLHMGGGGVHRVRDVDDSVIEVLFAMRSLGDALDRMHGAMGDDMEMNLTDLRALRMMVERERRGHAVSPHDLARHLRISTASTSKLIDRLEAAGHVERRPHPSDRRARVLVLTEHSRRTFFAHFGEHLATMRAVTMRYPPDQREVIGAFLDEMARALDPV